MNVAVLVLLYFFSVSLSMFAVMIIGGIMSLVECSQSVVLELDEDILQVKYSHSPAF